MIEITDKPIRSELVINKAKTDSSGCVLAYVGVIRDYSHDKPVLSVEYGDPEGTAENGALVLLSFSHDDFRILREPV